MRSLVASGLAVLAAVQGVGAHADPVVPEAGSLRSHREDAERMAWQLRDLDRAAAADSGMPDSAPSARPAAAGDPHRADAAARMDRGLAAYRGADYVRAVGELVEASRLSPDWPEPYRWLALAEIELDDCASAMLNVAAFAARVPPGDHRVPELAALRVRCLHRPRFGFAAQPGGVDSLHAREVTGAPSGGYDRPLIQRWWLWSAVGLATAAVVGVIWATSGSGSGSGTATGPGAGGDHGLPGVTCDATGCHP